MSENCPTFANISVRLRRGRSKFCGSWNGRLDELEKERNDVAMAPPTDEQRQQQHPTATTIDKKRRPKYIIFVWVAAASGSLRCDST